MDWLNVTEIILNLSACFACYLWGKSTGVSAAIEVLLHKKIIKESDLKKLNED